MRKIVVLTAVIVLTFVSYCYGLETDTHEALNEYIARNTFNGFSLDTYLKDQLGLQGGIEEEFNSQRMWWWLKKGGLYEDIPYWYMPYLRSVDHFHNPLTKQGFTDFNHWWQLWGFFGLLNGQSSVQWSQELIGNQSPGGHYSWHDVRDYFYNALTSTNQTTRDQNFADTFRGVGQLMHLVEDLSVPEHTRNAGHGPCDLSYNYECWALEKITSKTLPNYPPDYFDLSAIGNTNPLASVPVANLFDTNQYDGTNPNITVQNDIGLSEYTNANFLCPDTMFTSDFPHPAWNSVIQNLDPDPVTGRWYLTKLGQNDLTGVGGQIGNGEHIDHLAVSRWGYNRLPSSISQSGISLKMDKQVYADYAAYLIPRAVGYASELLNYFFRGQLAVVNSQWTATDVTFKIRNDTPNESMGPGTLVVSYEYDSGYGGVSNEVQMSESIAAGSESSNEYTVTFPQSISSNDSPKYWFVFRGKLGNEDDAVVAKAVIGSSKLSGIGCVAGCPPGEVCPNNLFYVPPLADDGGSFTVEAPAIFYTDNYFIVDCSYGSGNMSCDLTLYYQHPDWNNGNPVLCARDHCEGPWDGYSFYDVCTLVYQGQGVCHQSCDPDPNHLVWIWLFTQ